MAATNAESALISPVVDFLLLAVFTTVTTLAGGVILLV